MTTLGLTNIRYHQLDIDDQKSIENFAKYIKDTYQGLDVLINNAAIAYKVALFFSLVDAPSKSLLTEC